MEAEAIIGTVVAYHAAARAVVATALGHEVHGFAVHDGGDCVSHRPRGGRDRQPDVELVILMAGECADRELAVRMHEELKGWPAGCDLDSWLDTIRKLESGAVIYCPDAAGCWPDNDALNLAWALGPTADCDRRHRIDVAIGRASEILASEWADVEAIARCLGARL